jgi:hypothetical protein
MEYLSDLLLALIALGGVFLFLLSTVLGNLLSEYASGRCARSARTLIEQAVKKLPEELQDRYGREWRAHLSEASSNPEKLAHAFQCYWIAVPTIAKMHRNKRLTEEVSQTQTANENMARFNAQPSIRGMGAKAKKHLSDFLSRAEKAILGRKIFIMSLVLGALQVAWCVIGFKILIDKEIFSFPFLFWAALIIYNVYGVYETTSLYIKFWKAADRRKKY